MSKIGFIGTGVMGKSIIRNMMKNNLSVNVYNRTKSKTDDLVAEGAVWYDTPKAIAEASDIIFTMVGFPSDVEGVYFNETGMFQADLTGKIVVDLTTSTPTLAEKIAKKAAEVGAHALDAPVSGGAVKAANGEMTVMASGSDIAFERLAPVLEAVAGKVYRIGAEPGLGSTVKIIHQLLAGVHIAAGAEAMALAARAGIPLDVMYDVVTNAAGNSWMFENRMRHVVDGDYTPHSAVDIFVKDLGLVADTAKALHFPLPLASTALNMFTSASNAGYGKEDDSAVIKIFSGITLPGAKS